MLRQMIKQINRWIDLYKEKVDYTYTKDNVFM